MAVELVDGYAGHAHIGSDDLAVFNEATFGTKEGVFSWGNNFKCTVESANKVTISTGAGLIEGRRFYEPTATTLTIRSGSQRLQRYDLVVAQYKKQPGTNIESVVLKVIEGEAASSPKDPAVEPGCLKLWRLVVDGITLREPIALFHTIATTKGQNFELHDNKGFSFMVRGNTATLVAYGVSVGGGDWDKTTAGFMIPSKYLPRVSGQVIQISQAAYNNNGAMSGYIWVTANGEVSAGNGGGKVWAETHFAVMTWAIEQ